MPIQITDLTPHGCVIKPRVTVKVWEGLTPDETLLQTIRSHHQCMLIVNTRATARRIWQQLPGAFHLSTWMCPAHRADVLADIRRRLSAGNAVRLISTQLIEAGVDISFPLVMRAWAGLASLTQSAGRSNRHGTDHMGQLIVLDLDGQPRRGTLAGQIAVAREVWGMGRWPSPIEPGAVAKYNELLVARVGKFGLDQPNVMGMAGMANPNRYNQSGLSIRFQAIADAMRLIESTDMPVLVPYKQGCDWIRRLMSGYQPTRDDLREISRYVASVSESDFAILVRSGQVVDGDLPYLKAGAYDEVAGLNTNHREP